MIANVIVFGTASILIALLNFAFVSIASHLLVPEELAKFIFAYSIFNVLGAIFIFGSVTKLSIIRTSNSSQSKELSQNISVIYTQLEMSLYILPILLLVIFVLQHYGMPVILITAAIFAGAFKSLQLLYANVVRIDGQVTLFLLSQLAPPTLALGSIGFLYALDVSFTSNDYFYALAIPVVICSLVSYYLLLKKIGVQLNLSVWKNSKRTYQFSFWAALHAFFASLMTMGDRYVLWFFLAGNEYAVYSIAAVLASLLSLVYTSLNQAIVPHLYRQLNASKSRWQLVVRFSLRYFLFCLMIFLIYQLSLNTFVSIILPDEYFSSIKFARWLALGCLIQASYQLFSSVILFKKKPMMLTKITVAVGLFALANTVLCAYLGGANAVIFAFSANWLIFLVVTSFFARRLYVSEVVY
ncbi:lipopolysaccharide biosynthesis protein [Shewanella atlantica]|uniref:Lipopolysaccharide biosynthesis protein n=1 Tax=Shewanella atlantica TaxID=271099 RepID=A0A431WB59_9GAMM|nr:lipopolysaccharide biosynthesis protein [Shewanella atlantica]RTR32528.1 lipopolysaccharide biosynthesis protein [Shewanella atlantica]